MTVDPGIKVDVGSSYHTEAEFGKCRIVHPLIGNVSWVNLPVFVTQMNASSSDAIPH